MRDPLAPVIRLRRDHAPGRYLAELLDGSQWTVSARPGGAWRVRRYGTGDAPPAILDSLSAVRRHLAEAETAAVPIPVVRVVRDGVLEAELLGRRYQLHRPRRANRRGPVLSPVWNVHVWDDERPCWRFVPNLARSLPGAILSVRRYAAAHTKAKNLP